MKHSTLIFLLLTISLLNCGETKESKSTDTNIEDSYLNFLANVKLPEKLTLFGEEIPIDIPEVRERAEREFYLNLQSPGQIILYLKRAGKYFPAFRKVIKENNMPEDFIFLSVAESALYMARSTKDAVGLWQFIPSTGKAMGLIIDEYVDERRHVEKSTEAAMQYLKNGFTAHKSWILAAAGYNMGHENVKSNLDFQNKENYFDLYLNEETSRYILRIAIIKEIIQNSEKYGINLSQDQIYKPEKVKYIKVNYQIASIAEWADKQNTTYKDVKLLNPWILTRQLPSPSKGKFWEIAIPG